MKIMINNKEKFHQTLTAKVFFIIFLTVGLFIPSCMVKDLIHERQQRSMQTITSINSKWSGEQTLSGVILSVPYIERKNFRREEGVLNFTPEEVKINVKLYPEERHYGIYKTILYKSDVEIDGYFAIPGEHDEEEIEYFLKNSSILLGISDFKGIATNVVFQVNDTSYVGEPLQSHPVLGPVMGVKLRDLKIDQGTGRIAFKGNFQLRGSSGMNFSPLGKNSVVKIEGNWQNPGFTGEFAPDYVINKDGFAATWNIMSFNRSLPARWSGTSQVNIDKGGFGVNLISPVDHYQQNMRSAKYSLMFIVLTFIVFFFIEVLGHKRIHIVQYALVGAALILFYTLLLSISEQLNFGVAYLISSVATILLIVLYAYGIFKNKVQTFILGGLLAGLYAFLYVTLQLEEIALLVGSIGLFIILAVIMYFSRRINWDQNRPA
ncbi:MAG: cell envelope integrity protein CreD [Tannerellaceae bacterium]|nr:cell envelope integrity protein CreD [Tannerellaceae bacterium]